MVIAHGESNRKRCQTGLLRIRESRLVVVDSAVLFHSTAPGVMSRNVVHEWHRVGLVLFFLADCWFERWCHLLKLVGFDEPNPGLRE